MSRTRNTGGYDEGFNQTRSNFPSEIYLIFLLFRLLAEKDKIERKLNIQGEKKDD
jgi:hypothetical protein